METKFKPGDKVTYNGKPYTILEYSYYATGLHPDGGYIWEEADDKFTLIDKDGNKIEEVFQIELEKENPR